MRHRLNKGIDLRAFSYQLTEWLKAHELDGIVTQIRKHAGNRSYGKYYVIKRDKKSLNYAVFTRGSNIVHSEDSPTKDDGVLELLEELKGDDDGEAKGNEIDSDDTGR